MSRTTRNETGLQKIQTQMHTHPRMQTNARFVRTVRAELNNPRSCMLTHTRSDAKRYAAQTTHACVRGGGWLARPASLASYSATPNQIASPPVVNN